MRFKPHEMTIGRYRVRYLLGRGGMSSVYLAQTVGPSGFNRWVALKIIPPQAADDEQFISMFTDEARLSARLYHQNVCTVFDHGVADGIYYIAMEYLHGESLSVVTRRDIPVELAVQAVRDVARGLHAAHELRDDQGELLGLVHRDVSPQNIVVLYDGHAKILDFGIARARERLTETTTSSLKGKVAYMAPEQLAGAPADRRTDVFALGIVLWEATLGWRLFKRSTAVSTMQAVVSGDIPSPAKVKKDYPPELDGVVLRALQRDPEGRFTDMQAFADALDEALYSMGRRVGSAHLAKWMSSAFAERKAEREEMLRTPLQAAEGAEEPPIEVVVVEEDAPARTHGRSRSWVFAAVVLVAAVVAGALVLSRPQPRRAPPESPENTLDSNLSTLSTADGAPAAQPRRDQPPDGRQRSDASESTGPLDGAPGDEPQAAPRRRYRAQQTKTSAAGFVNIVAIPAAEVWIGGRRLGTTPIVRLRLRPGRHPLRLRSLSDGRERRVSVEVRSGELSRVAVRFEE